MDSRRRRSRSLDDIPGFLKEELSDTVEELRSVSFRRTSVVGVALRSNKSHTKKRFSVVEGTGNLEPPEVYSAKYSRRLSMPELSPGGSRDSLNSYFTQRKAEDNISEDNDDDDTSGSDTDVGKGRERRVSLTEIRETLMKSARRSSIQFDHGGGPDVNFVLQGNPVATFSTGGSNDSVNSAGPPPARLGRRGSLPPCRIADTRKPEGRRIARRQSLPYDEETESHLRRMQNQFSGESSSSPKKSNIRAPRRKSLCLALSNSTLVVDQGVAFESANSEMRPSDRLHRRRSSLPVIDTCMVGSLQQQRFPRNPLGNLDGVPNEMDQPMLRPRDRRRGSMPVVINTGHKFGSGCDFANKEPRSPMSPRPPYERRKSLPSNDIPTFVKSGDFRVPHPPEEHKRPLATRRRSDAGIKHLSPIRPPLVSTGSFESPNNLPSGNRVAPIPGRKLSFVGSQQDLGALGATAAEWNPPPARRRSFTGRGMMMMDESYPGLVHLVSGEQKVLSNNNLAITRQDVPNGDGNGDFLDVLYQFRQMHGIRSNEGRVKNDDDGPYDDDDDDDDDDIHMDVRDEELQRETTNILDVETEQVLEVLQEKIENEMTCFNCSDDEETPTEKKAEVASSSAPEVTKKAEIKPQPTAVAEEDMETVLPPRTPEPDIIQEFDHNGAVREECTRARRNSYQPRYCWCTRCQMMYRMYKEDDDRLQQWGNYPCHKF